MKTKEYRDPNRAEVKKVGKRFSRDLKTQAEEYGMTRTRVSTPSRWAAVSWDPRTRSP